MIAYGKKINDLASLDVQNFFKNAEYYTFEFEIKNIPLPLSAFILRFLL